MATRIKRITQNEETLQIPQIAPFRINMDPTSVGSRWKTYIEKLKIMYNAYNVKNDKQKKALLLHNAGDEVLEIYLANITEQNEEMSFSETIEFLTKYFTPKVNIDYQIHLFREAEQEEEEKIDSFCTRLKRLATSCQFVDDEREIKTQIIQKCYSKELRRKALQKEMNLQELLGVARSFELCEEQANKLERSNKRKAVFTTNSQPKYKKHNLTCFRCGGKFPHINGDCPAMGKKCNSCGRMNHFAKECKVKKPFKNVAAVANSENVSTDSGEDEQN